MMRPLRQLALGLSSVAVLAIVAAVTGCAEEKTSIDLAEVPMPEGGSVYTVAVLDGPDRLDLVAPSHAGIFVHRNDTGPWQRVEPNWPSQLPQQQSAPLHALGAPGASRHAAHDELFCAHGDRLWMVTEAPGAQENRLLTSSDAGRSWQLVELPDDAETGAQPDAADAQKDSSSRPPSTLAGDKPRRPAAHVRLLDRGEQGLFLINSSHLWQIDAPPGEPLGDKLFRPISLEGIEADKAHPALPQVLRHYLPASPSRPFEVMTVLRDKLGVYRRRADQKSWEKVAEVARADRELVAVPTSQTLLMLTPSGLLTSGDEAETWKPITLPRLTQSDAQGVALDVLPPADEAPPVVLLSLESGGVYRSVDMGEQWSEVRPPDADQRTITGFTHSARRNRVWASTRGSGVLRSLDRGQTWHQINDELRATRAFDIGVDDNGGFLLGSDAGLFRLVGTPRDGNWQMLQNRSTTAIHVEASSGVILNGTASGAIVRLEPNGKTTTAEAAPFDRLDEIAYQPMRFRGVELPARAIVQIEARPESSQVFAWSTRQGPLTSLDGGVSWTRLTLNPAFRSALEGSYLSNFTTDFDERMYLVTHALSETSPTQLWRSYNNGETWHAVSSFARDERRTGIYVARSAAYPPEVLFMAHRNRFAKSLDGGNSWTDIPGPWSEGQVLLYQLDGRDHLLVVDARHTVNLLRVSGLDEDSPAIRAYDLKWPEAERTHKDDLRRLVMQDGRVFAATPSGLLTGLLPDGQQKLPDGLAIILTIVSILVLTSIGFGVLYWKA